MSEQQSLSKTFEPAQVEQPIYRKWLEAGAFHAVPDAREKRYVVMMPLPNVTGALHMGHAMDNVMQDLLTRWHRMMGDNTLWMPGTDHAGIATQSVVEKRLKELEGKTRHDIGREALVERILAVERPVPGAHYHASSSAWAAAAIGIGSASRWTRSARGPCATRSFACSRRADLSRQAAGQLGCVPADRVSPTTRSITRPSTATSGTCATRSSTRKPGEPTFIVEVATTRPETMLGDTAVAVHPDPRSKSAAVADRKDSPKPRASSAPTKRPELERLRERRSSAHEPTSSTS
jgi:valyl-tRNA synthetase